MKESTKEECEAIKRKMNDIYSLKEPLLNFIIALEKSKSSELFNIKLSVLLFEYEKLLALSDSLKGELTRIQSNCDHRYENSVGMEICQECGHVFY